MPGEVVQVELSDGQAGLSERFVQEAQLFRDMTVDCRGGGILKMPSLRLSDVELIEGILQHPEVLREADVDTTARIMTLCDFLDLQCLMQPAMTRFIDLVGAMSDEVVASKLA